MKIQRKLVGAECAPLVIAEMSGNHNQSLARALEIVDAAAKAGSHALKIQTYTADTITINIREREFFICLLYTSPSPRDRQKSRMPSSA